MPAFEPVDYLTDLTEAQREAVTHIDGPLLVVAGPGSGKTRVITRRIAHLYAQGINPQSVLGVTFTNKAAAEMRTRVGQLLPQGVRVDPYGVELPPSRFMHVRTFHSFGAWLLRRYSEDFGLDSKFSIYDEADRIKMVKTVLGAASVDTVRFTPEAIQTAISRAKNELLTAERYAARARDFFSQTVAQVYPAYEKRMRDANAVDFDDLLLIPALVLQQHEELRTALDYRFRYVLIDEYQDTNKAQYELAKSLSRDHPNLCVVGDVDQSIYKWRGADIKNILDFEKDFPNARVITLDRNYRSTKAILSAAAQVIAHNKKRKPHPLYTENPQGDPVRVLGFETGLDEAAGIVQRIRQAVEKGKHRYRDVAVFLRVNALSRALETAFVKERVPFQIVRGLAFFERKENRDVLAYLRLLINPRDDLSFERVVNEPPRGVGKTSLDHLQAYAKPRELSLLDAAREVDKVPGIRGKAVTGIRSFLKIMDDLRQVLDAPPDEVIRQVLDRSGYRRMLMDSKDAEDAERLANIEELITAAQQFVAEDPERTLTDWLENITLASDVDGLNEAQDCVAVMTLHAAKGLEFPVVYMAAMEQGILPHERSIAKDEDLEEERRLAFVGMTRAKEELYLCCTRLREFRGQTLYAVPSMFLDELPEEGVEQIDLRDRPAGSPEAYGRWRHETRAADEEWEEIPLDRPHKPARARVEPDDIDTDYAEGMTVRHEKYGVGRITAVSGYGAMRKIKIRFGAAGERTFVANKAKLVIVQNA